MTLTASLQKRLSQLGIRSRIEGDAIVVFDGVRRVDGARMVVRIHEAERADLLGLNAWAWQELRDRRR